ncbi:Hypothetical_protein [Hexamita inflata]|uniref:Hypothetical_protein n=1 Tax=Hexamita inflata TaxID=28002 RepID=A0AA86VPW5_9EUKA|nr:Hypothetical protein HINF_LOCUS60423 [Hexamita inflata]
MYTNNSIYVDFSYLFYTLSEQDQNKISKTNSELTESFKQITKNQTSILSLEELMEILLRGLTITPCNTFGQRGVSIFSYKEKKMILERKCDPRIRVTSIDVFYGAMSFLLFYSFSYCCEKQINPQQANDKSCF